MIYVPERNAAFCHIPRTSGIAVMFAIMEAFPGVMHAPREMQHITSRQIRKLHPGAQVFSIIRNPWDVYASNYGWQLRNFPEVECRFNGFTRYSIINGWPAKRGGLFKTFLDEDVVVFKFENDPYAGISELLGRELTVWRTNESLCPAPTWLPEIIDEVGAHCHYDIERFGYMPPPAA